MDYKVLSDNSLWTYFCTKDKKAFEQIYQRYFSSLLFYALSLGFNIEFVEDCIQDLFVKLFTLEPVPEVQHVKAYLFKSLRNSIYDKLKSEQNTIELKNEITENLIFDDQYIKNIFKTSDEDIKNTNLLIKCYNQLNENQRSAIYLYYVRELSWEEMGIVLNISPHSCMNLLSRSIVKLKKLFENGASTENEHE